MGSEKDRYRGRLWIKLQVTYLVPTVVIVAGISWLAYRAARVAMEEQLGEALTSVARSAAILVGRPWAIQLSSGDEQSLTYRNLKKKLFDLTVASEASQIYLFDKQRRALVDSDGVLPIGKPIVKLAADRAELHNVFNGLAQASLLFTGKDGQLYKSGFAPVWIDGKVEAAVGVDGSARFFGPLEDLSGTLLFVGAVALALVVLLTLVVSRQITRPLGRLTDAASAIGRGDLGTEIRAETGDEIGFLASTLNEMRSSIEERDRTLQMMLSGIAHEVRNPLGGMALFAGLLEEELVDKPTALQHLNRIKTELDYLARVVTDFLEFARHREIERSETDPGMELEEIRCLCDGDLQRAGVSIQSDLAPGIGTVCWDRERMRRAVLNLVRNAIQASPSGGVVRISLRRENQNLVLSISDQGSGIPEDRRAMIFQPFYTTRQQGTGLGLALVKKIVEAHAGSISFTSEVGQGTTFKLVLPVSNSPQPGSIEKEATPWPAS